MASSDVVAEVSAELSGGGSDEERAAYLRQRAAMDIVAQQFHDAIRIAKLNGLTTADVRKCFRQAGGRVFRDADEVEDVASSDHGSKVFLQQSSAQCPTQ